MSKSLKFYNVKTRKSFTTSNYKVVIKDGVRGKRRFAVAKQDGVESWRVLGN